MTVVRVGVVEVMAVVAKTGMFWIGWSVSDGGCVWTMAVVANPLGIANHPSSLRCRLLCSSLLLRMRV